MKTRPTDLIQVDLFDPLVIFPVLYIGYFLAGIIFDLDRAAVANATEFPWLIVSVSLVVFLVGALAGRWLVGTIDPKPSSWKVPWTSIAYTFVAIGALATATLLITGQIGIAGEAVRIAIDPNLAGLALLLWFGALYLLALNAPTMNRRWVFWLIAAILVAVAAVAGYRTPMVLIVVIAAVEWHYLIRRVSKRIVIVSAVVIVLLLSGVSVLRLLTEADIPVAATTTTVQGAETTEEPEGEESSTELSAEEKRWAVRQHAPWLRRATGTPLSGRLALVRIIQYVDAEGPLNGELHEAAFLTVLPGTQQAPRSVVTDVVNSIGSPLTRPGLTTTPTLVGQFYLDGGWVLLLLGMALVGLILGIWHAFAVVHCDLYPGMVFGYGFALAVALVGIHSGILDVTVFGLLLGAAAMTVAPGQPRAAIDHGLVTETALS